MGGVWGVGEGSEEGVGLEEVLVEKWEDVVRVKE